MVGRLPAGRHRKIQAILGAGGMSSMDSHTMNSNNGNKDMK